MKTFLKSTFNTVGVFAAGVGLSACFVLISNDMFYKYTVRKLFINTNTSKAEIWEEIKPRELFNQGAKKTFIKHKLDEERDDELKKYYGYIEKRKQIAEGGLDEDKIFVENIYEKKSKF